MLRSIAQPRRRIHIPASTPSPESGPPTAGVLNLSHDPSSPGAGFRGVPGEPASLPSRRSASPLGFLPPSPGPPGVPLPRGPGYPSGSWGGRRKLPRSNSKCPFSWRGGVLPLPQLWGPAANFPRRRALPAPSPAPAARLPRGPHEDRSGSYHQAPWAALYQSQALQLEMADIRVQPRPGTEQGSANRSPSFYLPCGIVSRARLATP